MMRTLYILALSTALSTAIVQESKAQSTSDLPATDQQTGVDGTEGVADIIVTAQKRNERLIDVPLSVTQIDSDVLVSQNLTTIREFFTRIPGLQYTGGAGQTTLAIRGVSADVGGNPTVGITIDDVPFPVGGQIAPDLDPAILKNVAVLRGPQGTLYGASSLGGLLKFETVTPDPNKFSGRIEAGSEVVLDGGSGYSTRGALNIPVIEDRVGISLSGFYRRAPGYLDYTALQSGPQNAANTNRSYGGRAALFIKPVDGLSINLSFLDQELRGQGGTTIGLNGDFRPLVGSATNNFSRTLPIYSTRVRLYTGRIDADLGFGTLSSITGYTQSRYSLNNDLTFIFAPVLGVIQRVFGLPIAGDRADLTQFSNTNRFSQEVRLASNPGQKLEWLVGAFYNYDKALSNQTLLAINPTTNAVDATVFDTPSPYRFREIAGFADATYNFTDKLSLQGGLRYADNRQRSIQTATGPLALLQGAEDSDVRSSDSSWTWLLSPQYKINANLNLYGRVATGYRPGGPNSGLTPNNLTYEPDRTTNYEIGLKGSVLDRKLVFSASGFWIDWRNIQLLSIDADTQVAFTDNGGRARSRGAEVEVSYNAWKGGVLAANGAYIDAALRDALVGQTIGLAGDRLPLSSRWSGNLSFDQSFVLTPELNANLGTTLSYVGPHFAEFPAEGDPRGYSRGYATLDLRAGIESHGISFSLYARNITDSKGIISVSTSGNPYTGSIVQPRSVGGLISFNF
ncbi:Outer membrane receptor proteins, mostly Fe transport [Sphingomonas carotinifaciens]|uniref:Outer membrane receptor proteins, mostly Fe transport n=2 Tax=Sphingomonas carotinifaciens TaxID=1166323 RepID=A0A1G7PZM3_9SPHN|nr:TonB-dependent receptor [Sphingomonas carotinifaciens]MBB4087576.1 outer membrane receptor protein involved in Fe transport [Sphingomonas carotinifaciens]MWC45660.1 TonB-dependent receptor plug domain-containing protein [Sphingomonas carotinifaciens]SDF91752.1 Outer membrane receptor proteins, mostly Fe transport [Sphingomonas carotinifaciens]